MTVSTTVLTREFPARIPVPVEAETVGPRRTTAAEHAARSRDNATGARSAYLHQVTTRHGPHTVSSRQLGCKSLSDHVIVVRPVIIGRFQDN